MPDTFPTRVTLEDLVPASAPAPAAPIDYSSPQALIAQQKVSDTTQLVDNTTRLIEPKSGVIQHVDLGQVNDALASGWRPATTAEVSNWDEQGDVIAFHDPRGGSLLAVPKERIDEARSQGLIVANKDLRTEWELKNPTIFVKDSTGRVDPVQRSEWPRLQAQGYTRATDEEVASANSGIDQQAKTFLASAANGASFGTLDPLIASADPNWAAERAVEREQNPISDTTGNIAGIVGGSVAMPLGNALRAGAAARAAGQVGARAMATRIAGEALAGALEAGGAGLVRRAAESMSGDPQLDVEHILLGAGQDALLGGTFGGLMKGVSIASSKLGLHAGLAMADGLETGGVGTKLAKGAISSGLKYAGVSAGGLPGLIVAEGVDHLASNPKVQEAAMKALIKVSSIMSKGTSVGAKVLPRSVADIIDRSTGRGVEQVMDEGTLTARMSAGDEGTNDIGVATDVVRSVYGQETGDALQATIEAKQDFLRQKADELSPKARDGAMDQPTRMSLEKRRTMTRYVSAIDDPAAAFARLAHGLGTPQDREVLQRFYPKTLQGLQQTMTQFAASNGIPRPIALRLDRTLGTSLTRNSDPEYVNWLQSLSPQGAQENSSSPGGGIPRQSGPSVSVSPGAPSDARLAHR